MKALTVPAEQKDHRPEVYRVRPDGLVPVPCRWTWQRQAGRWLCNTLLTPGTYLVRYRKDGKVRERTVTVWYSIWEEEGLGHSDRTQLSVHAA